MTFSNEQIDTVALPKIEEVEFQVLQKNYLKATILGTFLFWVFIYAAFAVFYLINEFNIPAFILYAVLGVILVLSLFNFYVVIYGFKEMGYALREKDILYKSGLFWKSRTTIPFNRIQHGEIKQGPIERFFDLSQLNIYTAGGSSSDLKIPGLHPDKAKTLKRYILSKTASVEEE